MRFFVLGLTLVGLLPACANEPAKAPPHEDQSYFEAVTMLCNVDALAHVDADDVLGAEGARTDYLMEHIKNSDGIYLYTLFRTRDPNGQIELLTNATREAKVQSCPLLGPLRETASATPAPQND